MWHFSDLIKLRLDTYIYMLLHKPGHSTVTPLMALTSSLHDRVKLDFPVFCDAFLKLRKLCKPHNNFDEENYNFIWTMR